MYSATYPRFQGFRNLRCTVFVAAEERAVVAREAVRKVNLVAGQRFRRVMAVNDAQPVTAQARDPSAPRDGETTGERRVHAEEDIGTTQRTVAGNHYSVPITTCISSHRALVRYLMNPLSALDHVMATMADVVATVRCSHHHTLNQLADRRKTAAWGRNAYQRREVAAAETGGNVGGQRRWA